MKHDAIEDAFKIYVADSLRLSAENKYISTKFSEIIHPKPEETRTKAEIVDLIRGKLR